MLKFGQIADGIADILDDVDLGLEITDPLPRSAQLLGLGCLAPGDQSVIDPAQLVPAIESGLSETEVGRRLDDTRGPRSSSNSI